MNIEVISPTLALLAAAGVSLGLLESASSQTRPPDLDRDGVPNLSDRDVDNDGIPNGLDRNIDGGVARSGPLRGRYIGDQLANDDPAELDMDADGLADGALRETDIDGDGLADNSPNETDIDGDGRADNVADETDIDGDGLADGARGEADIDGDGVANGLDGNVDGDALANLQDPDLDGTGVDDSTLDILYEVPDNPRAYADDALAADSIAFVSAEVRKALQIPVNDPGLRVRVQLNDPTGNQPGRWGGLITGVWRYFSADRIQVWAKWCYPADDPDPAKLRIFASYTYKGPLSGRIEDYANPENYDVSDESKLAAGYSIPPGELSLVRIATSPSLGLSWVPGSPVNFGYSAPGDDLTGFPPPTERLRTALLGYPDGNLPSSIPFPGVEPVLKVLRTIRQVNLTWYGQLEARQLR